MRRENNKKSPPCCHHCVQSALLLSPLPRGLAPYAPALCLCRDRQWQEFGRSRQRLSEVNGRMTPPLASLSPEMYSMYVYRGSVISHHLLHCSCVISHHLLHCR